jgi:hypothetical protein
VSLRSIFSFSSGHSGALRRAGHRLAPTGPARGPGSHTESRDGVGRLRAPCLPCTGTDTCHDDAMMIADSASVLDHESESPVTVTGSAEPAGPACQAERTAIGCRSIRAAVRVRRPSQDSESAALYLGPGWPRAPGPAEPDSVRPRAVAVHGAARLQAGCTQSKVAARVGRNFRSSGCGSPRNLNAIEPERRAA